MPTFVRSRRGGARILAAAVVLLALAACSRVEPLTAPGTTQLVTFDPTTVGYTRSEFLMAGVAQSYSPTAPLTADGKFSVAADPLDIAGDFRTRMVVYRPADPEAFNGTVVVEWLNVTAGQDFANSWIMGHNELIREGAAYVGVSVQAVGVNFLKGAQPARYGNLLHPGDSYSYSIFTEAARRIRFNPDVVLGGLVPERLIGVGESQSASRLVTYINGIHPLVHVYDGFLVHSRGAGGSALSQAPRTAVPVPSPVQIRDDLDVPVLVVQAEGDVINSNLGARQPDTDLFRLWEMAGTSHADSYMVNIGFTDTGDGQGAIRMFELMRAPQDANCTLPINAGPHHWIMNAAFFHLDAWVRDGTLPPAAARLDVVSSSPVELVRDAQGNAVGGIRTPHVDAAIATLDGRNTGSGFCRLFGATTPFDLATLTALYGDRQGFLDAWQAAIDDAVAAGFLLPADAAELTAAAVASTILS